MTFRPENSLPFMVPENVAFSKDQQQFLLQLTDAYTKLAKASNGKDIGSYENIELVNGQRFFGQNNQSKHQIYRKVVECGMLPNTGLSITAHGISGLGATSMFTRIYGTARNPLVPVWLAIPNYQSEITVDNTNIYITTTANLTAYTYSIVVIEYFKA
jgi:hypothetical protein